MPRTLGLLMACLLVGSAASAQSAPAIERTVQLKDIPGVDAPVSLHVSLQSEHAAQMDRIVDAAQEALSRYSEWIFPYPDNGLTIVDIPWNSKPSAAGGFIALRTRWLVPAEVLTPEAEVVRGVGAQWWGGAIKVSGVDGAGLTKGLNRYLQDRVLARIFDRRHQMPAYSVLDERYFDRFIPWTFRAIHLSRDPMESDARIALAFHTLERYVGWPALQRSLALIAQESSGKTITVADFVSAFNAASGRDLTWFFEQAVNSTRVFDYAVSGLTSVPATGQDCAGKPCYMTTLVVRREGDGLFTGTGRAPVGDYESGRALPVLLTFADGQRLTDHWDGRARSETFTYASLAPALSAEIDPDRILLLDANDTNNSQTLKPAAEWAASKWALIWMVWLQDLLLTYAFFV